MDRDGFDASEARFISEKIILHRLGMTAEHKGKALEMPAKCARVISEIEALEKIWSYRADDRSNSFGQKDPDETIRLWSVPKMSAKVISYLTLHIGAKTILELGTSAGYSTIHLAIAAMYTEGHVFTVEALHKKACLAEENFAKAGLSNIITTIEDKASQTITDWSKGSIDFVFLDADKERYGEYLDLLLPLMPIGGIIVADNINDYGHRMQDYLQKVTGSRYTGSRCDMRVRSTYVAQLDNGLMITRKISDD